MLFEQTVEALKATGVFFEPTKPIYITRAPGRLDVMGGNDDYTGGLVFESTISEATYAAAQLRNDQSVVLKNKTVTEAGWQGDIQISIDELKNEIIGFARKKLGPAVAPKELAFVDSLPKTRSGKVLRRLLKARELGLPEGDISTLEQA